MKFISIHMWQMCYYSDDCFVFQNFGADCATVTSVIIDFDEIDL